jgi:hypothetical protein
MFWPAREGCKRQGRLVSCRGVLIGLMRREGKVSEQAGAEQVEDRAQEVRAWRKIVCREVDVLSCYE